MVTALRWAALVAFLSLPVMLFLGGPTRHPCPGSVFSPCEPHDTSPIWTHTAFLAALWLAVMLLLLSTVANHRAKEDRPSSRSD
jgi:hypothetical protein